jgi:putative hemolysin
MHDSIDPMQSPRLTLEPAALASPLDWRLETRWATSTEEVREAQRLRYSVFADELGARLCIPPGAPEGHDVDRFDEFCEHLLVCAVPNDDGPARTVGTYRVLTPEAARRAGGCYSDTEFDLGRLAPLRPRMVEFGRSCIDPGWRTGGAILALWGALGEFMVARGLDMAFGCASVDMKDGGHRAASLWRRLSVHHLGPAQGHATPRHPLPLARLRSDLEVATPPLIRGYLRCGARLLGAPAWDPDFNTADLPMLVALADLPPRHRRRFVASERTSESA